MSSRRSSKLPIPKFREDRIEFWMNRSSEFELIIKKLELKNKELLEELNILKTEKNKSFSESLKLKEELAGPVNIIEESTYKEDPVHDIQHGDVIMRDAEAGQIQLSPEGEELNLKEIKLDNESFKSLMMSSKKFTRMTAKSNDPYDAALITHLAESLKELTIENSDKEVVFPYLEKLEIEAENFWFFKFKVENLEELKLTGGGNDREVVKFVAKQRNLRSLDNSEYDYDDAKWNHNLPIKLKSLTVFRDVGPFREDLIKGLTSLKVFDGICGFDLKLMPNLTKLELNCSDANFIRCMRPFETNTNIKVLSLEYEFENRTMFVKRVKEILVKFTGLEELFLTFLNSDLVEFIAENLKKLKLSCKVDHENALEKYKTK